MRVGFQEKYSLFNLLTIAIVKIRNETAFRNMLCNRYGRDLW